MTTVPNPIDTSTANDDETSSPAATTSAAADERRRQWTDRLRKLHNARNEARNYNRKEVVEEDRRKKQPKNWESKRRRLEWQLEEEERRQQLADEGKDYDQLQQLDASSELLERQAQARKRKKNPDHGFSTYENATARQYERLTRQLQPDGEQYERDREQLGDDKFYATSSTILHNERKDPVECVDRLVEDLDKQLEKRRRFSRRRGQDTDGEIDFINDRNRKFNEKLNRFYAEHTRDIKQNLERGTAV